MRCMRSPLADLGTTKLMIALHPEGHRIRRASGMRTRRTQSESFEVNDPGADGECDPGREPRIRRNPMTDLALITH